eukprot:4610140-Alexandrium_andersonii.AAC.1
MCIRDRLSTLHSQSRSLVLMTVVVLCSRPPSHTLSSVQLQRAAGEEIHGTRSATAFACRGRGGVHEQVRVLSGFA